MTQEVFEIVREMDMGEAETQIVLRCAPLIAGLKISNLVNVQNGQAGRVQRLVKNTELSCLVLYSGKKGSAILLYRPKAMLHYLAGQGTRRMLWQLGYRDHTFMGLCAEFASRYTAYRRGEAGFPHEMGLFLGYPPEDVEGFIDNGGKNCLCSGYWKVYQDMAGKLRLFRAFDLAKEELVKLVAKGVSIEDVLKYA